MDGIFLFIGVQFIGRTVQFELRAGDAVGHPADDGGRTAKAMFKFFQTFSGEQNVGEIATSIRSLKLLDDGAVSDDLGVDAFGVPKGDQLSIGAILSFSESASVDPS